MELTTRLRQAKRVAIGGMRYPSTLRHLPRLMKTVGRTTLEQRQPWLPFEVIDIMCDHLDDGSQVCEFGGGGSTAWFADHAGHVVTIEDDSIWLERIRQSLGDTPAVDLIEGSASDDYREYITAIDRFHDDQFDLVLVDGRRRVDCFEHAIPKVARGGLLILDDVDRARYAPAFAMVDWPRTIYHGYAPGKDGPAHTAVFRRAP